MRDNAVQPTLRHVILFGTAAGGWLILFLVNLLLFKPSPTWWLRAAFSGALLIATTVLTVVLWRRLNRNKTEG